MKLGILRLMLVGPLSLTLTATTFAAVPKPNTSTTGQLSKDGTLMKQMSHDAANIFKQVNLAETALNANQKSVALGHVATALTDREKLAMTARTHNLAMVVPIYSEIEDQSVIGPVVASKNNGKTLPKMNAPIAIDSASDQFTFVGIDLDKTKTRLESARQSINSGNTQAAKDTLGAIGEDLVVTKLDMDAPLLAARENLSIARDAAKRHSYAEAKGALKEASLDLGQYSKMKSAQHVQEAANLQTQISNLSNSINAAQQDTAMAKIESWWNSVDSWMHNPTM